MKIWRGLINAFSYFTILPVPSSEEAPDAYTIGWLPLVGALAGFGAGWIGYGSFLLTHSQMWAAIGAFAGMVVLTGAIHLDGFLDCCDALLATTSVERRLEILKDPHHGSYAIVGMALLAIVWLASLYGIPPASMPLVLLFVGALSRAMVLYDMGLVRHARTGETMKGLRWISWLWVFALVPLALPHDARGILFFVAVFVSSFWAWVASTRLGGGLTGDVYGAVIVLTEVSLLKTISVYPALWQ